MAILPHMLVMVVTTPAWVYHTGTAEDVKVQYIENVLTGLGTAIALLHCHESCYVKDDGHCQLQCHYLGTGMAPHENPVALL